MSTGGDVSNKNAVSTKKLLKKPESETDKNLIGF